jgi:sugar phosphate isomerase/epimerase
MWTLAGFADEIDPDPDIQFRTLNELGIRFVEFRSAWDTNVLDLDDDQIARIKQKLASHGIRVSAVGSPIGKVGIDDDFDAHLARFDRALWVAEQLETTYIRLFSFFIPEADDPAAHREEVLRRMSALVVRSRGHDVVLCHENEKSIYGDVPARCLDLVKSVGSERLRLVWDAANFVQCGVRPYTDGYARLRPYLEYVQIKDALFETGQVVPAGQGDGEIDRTNRALYGDGFEGFFSMEPHLTQAGASRGFSGPELFAKATRAFTGLLEAAGIAYD